MDIQKALKIALGQWKMYAEMNEDTQCLETGTIAECDLYRACKSTLTTDNAKRGDLPEAVKYLRKYFNPTERVYGDETTYIGAENALTKIEEEFYKSSAGLAAYILDPALPDYIRDLDIIRTCCEETKRIDRIALFIKNVRKKALTTTAAISTQRMGDDDTGAAISEIIKCAAILATREYCVSEYQEDWGVKVPASVLHQIRKQNERLGSLAIRLKKSSDTLRAALTSKPETAGQEREGLGIIREALLGKLTYLGGEPVRYLLPEKREAALAIIDRLMGGEGNE